MTSRRRLEANRQNAQKSTGPKTDEGKSVSKMNAVKHGLLAQEFVLRGEDPDEFDALRDGLVAELRPNGCQVVRQAQAVRRGDGRGRAGHESDVFGPVQVADLLHHDAVPIEEQRRPAATGRRRLRPHHLAPDAVVF